MTDKIFNALFERYPSLEICREDIYTAYEMMLRCFESGSKLLCCGNGGSAADCDHFVGELMKGFLLKRPLSEKEKADFSNPFVANGLQKALPAVSLCAHSALMTAFANDECPDLVFAQQVYGYASQGDLLFVFTTSGNSANAVYAVEAAKAKGIASVAVTGAKESKVSALADLCVRLPETETFKIQELTLPLYHCLAAMVENKFFGNEGD
ncbi:MAG: SIS domain-containing protein [Clostridia bacterium]|nr:SIS domain-containing protein [Clostridia bacterium]